MIYKLSRLMLIGSVLATFFCVVALVAKFGGAIFVWIGIALLVAYAKRGYGTFTAFGTARWANADDLRAAGMLDANAGLIIGRVTGAGKATPFKGCVGAFQPLGVVEGSVRAVSGVDSASAQADYNPALVRMPKAVHTAVFAPTGVGKGVSCVIPFLLAPTSRRSWWTSRARILG